MKKISEFKNAPANMLLAIDKLNNLVFLFLENTNDNLLEDAKYNIDNIINGSAYFHPALFSVIKKTNSIYFVKCQYRSKLGANYNFELDIDITNDNANEAKFIEDYCD